ncbi:PTS sugar transporter subunit IIB [Escherichia coli]|nr:PTS sugar transporter subunit IIB [Escherichia coli]
MASGCAPGMKVGVVNVEKAVAVYHSPQYPDENRFYLFTRPQDALAMVRQEVKIGALNVGGMALAAVKNSELTSGFIR